MTLCRPFVAFVPRPAQRAWFSGGKCLEECKLRDCFPLSCGVQGLGGLPCDGHGLLLWWRENETMMEHSLFTSPMDFTSCPLSRWVCGLDVGHVTLRWTPASAFPDFLFSMRCWLRSVHNPRAVSVDSFLAHAADVQVVCLPHVVRLAIFLGVQPALPVDRRVEVQRSMVIQHWDLATAPMVWTSYEEAHCYVASWGR